MEKQPKQKILRLMVTLHKEGMGKERIYIEEFTINNPREEDMIINFLSKQPNIKSLECR